VRDEEVVQEDLSSDLGTAGESLAAAETGEAGVKEGVVVVVALEPALEEEGSVLISGAVKATLTMSSL